MAFWQDPVAMLDDMADHHTRTGHRFALIPVSVAARMIQFTCIDCGRDRWEVQTGVLADAHRNAGIGRARAMIERLSSDAGRAALVGTINQLPVLEYLGEKVRDDLPPSAPVTLYDHLLADD